MVIQLIFVPHSKELPVVTRWTNQKDLKKYLDWAHTKNYKYKTVIVLNWGEPKTEIIDLPIMKKSKKVSK